MQAKSQPLSAETITEMPVPLKSSISKRLNFRQVALQGLGDRHNSWAWSMMWWRGKLYVGTNRAWLCAERAAISAAFPFLARHPFAKYPPEDPDADCTTSPHDLPLQAEIWCWIPGAGTWERVYQSPQDVPIPGQPGKYVAREVGFRSMAVFVEPDGTEALYVSGVNSKFIYGHNPPSRLLRSTDGRTFEAVPQDQGTFMGELDVSTFRTIRVYKGRFFILAGVIYGDGVLLESSNPAGGNDNFQQVSPPEMRVFEMTPFNGYLYLGLRDTKRGYAVVKTMANGAPPYTFAPVVTDGAFLSPPSQSVISMMVYKDRLYVGTDRPAELIRINPDDTWDLLIGTPRQTPDGWKYPISGLDAGFSNWLNGHIWRMQVYNGRLYIGTMNMSTHFRNVSGAAPVLKPNYGFDLYDTTDGWYFTPITLTGFEDKFNFGLRTFADTPHGLFIGTANSCYGLQIWRGTLENSVQQAAQMGDIAETVSAPRQSRDHPTAVQNRKMGNRTCLPPDRLEVEQNDQKLVLSWNIPTGAKRFRVWRASISDERHRLELNPFLAPLLRIVRTILRRNPHLYLPPLPAKLWIPGMYTEIGAAEQFYFEDITALADKHYLYYVQAESDSGYLSGASNIVAAPPLVAPITFDSLLHTLDNGAADQPAEIRSHLSKVRGQLVKIVLSFQSDEMLDVDKQFQILSHYLVRAEAELAAADSLFLRDFQILLAKLNRRVALSWEGVISPDTV